MKGITVKELKKAFMLLCGIVCSITVLAGIGSSLIGPARLDVVAVGVIGLAIYFARPERRREARRKLAAKVAGEEKSFKNTHSYVPLEMISHEILVKELDERLMNGKRAYPALFRYTEAQISRELDKRMHSV
jgi:hypothetical protein